MADAGGDDDSIAGGELPKLTPEDIAVLNSETGINTSEEEDLFAQGDEAEAWEKHAAKDAAEREHKRTQNFRDHFDHMIVCTMWVIIVGFWFLAIIWAVNLTFGPYAWLNKDQLHNLQGLLTGGLLLGLLTKHIERRVEDRHRTS